MSRVKTILGEELIAPFDKISLILETLGPVQRQQVLEMLLVNHVYRFSRQRQEQRIMVEAFVKHVWQLLDQTVRS